MLLVDHDPSSREAVGGLLAGHGYRVETAGDGLQALQMLRVAPRDLLVLEVVVPKVDGVKLCAILREDRLLCRIPILIFTSLAARDLVRFRDLRVDGYVAKGPVELISEKLLSALKVLETQGRGPGLGNRMFVYEGFRPRRVVTQLIALKAHHEQVLDAFPQGVLEMDLDHRVLAANASAGAILGRRPGELIGYTLPSLFAADEAEGVQDALAELTARPTSSTGPLLVRAGPRRAALRLNPLRSAEGLEGILAVLEPNGLLP